MTKDPEIRNVEICLYAFSHRERRMDGLEEESDVRDLTGGYLKQAKCSVCRKVIANAKNLSAEGQQNETIFNNKNTLFVCVNFKSTRKEPCRFCMCRTCYATINAKDNDYDDNLITRRSSSRRK